MNLFHSAIGKETERQSAGRAGLAPITFADAIDLAVHDRIESVKAEWQAMERLGLFSVYQRYDWAAAFMETRREADGQPFIITGRYQDETVFILPCVIHGRVFRRLKFIGGSHVNFNLAIFSPEYGKLVTSESMTRLFRRIRQIVPGIGYMALCCQPVEWRGAKNPMIGLPHQRSANPAFVLDLEGGFSATLARGNAKRKRKKFRQQCRMAEGLGGYRLIKPDCRADIDRVIDIFFSQKSARLREQGIRDVFAEPEVRSFVGELANRSLLLDEPLLQLYALEVGGEILAIFGGGVLSGHLSGFFSSIDSRRHLELSPGEMLLYLVVEDACAAGYRQIDFGAGDERYKRSWSSETIDMVDIILPLNRAGMPLVTLRRIYGDLRRMLRESPAIWTAYKRMRRLRADLLRLIYTAGADRPIT